MGRCQVRPVDAETTRGAQAGVPACGRLRCLLRWGGVKAAFSRFVLLWLWGCDDPAQPPTPTFLVLTPADTAVSPGDTVRITATAFDADDAPIPGTPFRWRSLDTVRARVDTAGLVTARALGDARIEARAPNGLRGFATLRVREVTGFAPQHGAFGTVVTVRGQSLGAEPVVRFGGVPAFLKGVAATGRSLEAWVPVGASTGPLTVTRAGVAAVADGVFFVTGNGDDALEPNGFDEPAALPFPFENPSLVTRPLYTSRDADVYRFELPAAGPVRVELADRSLVIAALRATRMEVIDVAAQDIVGLVASYALFAERPIQPVTISLPRLRAGTYDVLLSPFAFTGSFSAIIPGDRSYGLRLDDRPTFALPPDSLEPNDYPRDAAPLPFPFVGELTLENPYGADYYRFELAATTDVVLQLNPGEAIADHDLDLFLMSAPAKSVPWIAATGEFPRIYMAAALPFSSEEIAGRLPAGQYLIGVLETAGVATRYRLRLLRQASGSAGRAAGAGAAGAGEKLAIWRGALWPKLRRR
ncbi:MAG: Ig-like domain-containing protein [Gemmatimonadetes bacterium]|nr:Ig-like domain-containing protein [Gemmatimonadota bacterium]